MITFSLALLYLQEVGIQSINSAFFVVSLNISLFSFVGILYNKIQIASIN